MYVHFTMLPCMHGGYICLSNRIRMLFSKIEWENLFLPLKYPFLSKKRFLKVRIVQ